MSDKLLKIINHYGVKEQLKYIHSEYYELDEAILSAECYKEMTLGDKIHITEEIADVLVMLEQFRLYYNISIESVKEIAKYKINRQLERISEVDNG